MGSSFTTEFYCNNNDAFQLSDEDVKIELHASSWNKESYYIYLCKTLEAEIEGSIYSINVYYNVPEKRNGNRIFGKPTYRSDLRFFPLFHRLVPKLHDINKKIIRKAILKQLKIDDITVDDIVGRIPADIQKYFNFT